ncbi:hypothetical protein SBOR_6338 [Sclerotinia borealis F-4128]|uniref:Uncharacterized protein n=1 Tax=Sclerotinia borealis (strain F-4128) TaxID=1432307 RepID=W9CFL7_SCLBF|nr:hypothetical protein SBOR_6338 [Sclerotinia borealis F-4128]
MLSDKFTLDFKLMDATKTESTRHSLVLRQQGQDHIIGQVVLRLQDCENAVASGSDDSEGMRLSHDRRDKQRLG